MAALEKSGKSESFVTPNESPVFKLRFMVGTVDCHFEENAQIAFRNVLAGRPIFEGQLPPTFNPPHEATYARSA